MKMEFVFDEEKCLQEGLTADACMDNVRAAFSNFAGNTVEETENGVFQGPIDNFPIFAAMVSFARLQWFRNSIREWYWTEEHTSFVCHDMIAELLGGSPDGNKVDRKE